MTDRSRGSPPADAATATVWHTLAEQDVLQRLGVTKHGLEPAEASRRLAETGPNRLPSVRPPGPLRRLLAQFHNLLIYVLMAAAALSLALGHEIDAIVIMLVAVVNALIGTVQEGRAASAIEAIRRLIDPQAMVLRDGKRQQIRADDLVPGDIVLVGAGDRVPADIRLLHARHLKIDEAALTGESVPVDKATDPVRADAALGDRASMAFTGTLVVAGAGTGVVVETGQRTQLGRISELVGSVVSLKTPLLLLIDRFAARITTIIFALSVLTFAFAILLRGLAPAEGLMVVISIAVASIPAGLPAIMSVTLAIGVQRMAGRNAIIRQLPAVETLGAVSVICSDKTGTLTRNEMTAHSMVTPGGRYAAEGVGYRPEGSIRTDPGDGTGSDVQPAQQADLMALVEAGLLCNDADLRNDGGDWTVAGDPMEGALVALAAKAGLDAEAVRKAAPRDDAIPFDTILRFMATRHRLPESAGRGAVIAVKGAPERIIAMCGSEWGPHGTAPIDRQAWLDRADLLASRGERVLGFARLEGAETGGGLDPEALQGRLVLLGLVGFIDPPRQEAMEAIAECRGAGIRVIMITGDHAVTAREIARKLGISDNPVVLTGNDLDALDAEGFSRAALEADVFARTTPVHKLRLVEALQANGLAVAMTGDGVNDAPALKRADVGVAMGRTGTDAAKQASEMVLADDNFASIVAAVREGRTVYDNLKKVIAWTLPTNGGEALVILFALVAGLVSPVTPLQILWINMVTVITLGVTLAFEPTEPQAMRRPPRPSSEPILDRTLLWRIAFVSSLMVCGSFGVFLWSQQSGLSIETGRTMAVNAIVMMEIAYLFSIRYAYGASLTWRGVVGTHAVLIGVALVVLGQLALIYLPLMNQVFATRPLDVQEFGITVGVAVILFILVEIEKALRRRLSSRAPRSRSHQSGRGLRQPPVHR